MDEADMLRERLHELADKLSTAVTRTEVTAVKLESVMTQLGPITHKVEEYGQRISVLETRAHDAQHAGAKWGGFVGGLIAAAVAVWHMVSGK